MESIACADGGKMRPGLMKDSDQNIRKMKPLSRFYLVMKFDRARLRITTCPLQSIKTKYHLIKCRQLRKASYPGATRTKTFLTFQQGCTIEGARNLNTFPRERGQRGEVSQQRWGRSDFCVQAQSTSGYCINGKCSDRRGKLRRQLRNGAKFWFVPGTV